MQAHQGAELIEALQQLFKISASKISIFCVKFQQKKEYKMPTKNEEILQTATNCLHVLSDTPPEEIQGEHIPYISMHRFEIDLAGIRGIYAIGIEDCCPNAQQAYYTQDIDPVKPARSCIPYRISF